MIAVLPTVFISVYSALSFQRSFIEEKKTYITNLCDGFTNEQRLIVRNAQEMLLAISQTRSVQNKEYNYLNTYLRDLMAIYPDYAVLLAADDKGTVVASGIGKTGYSLADRTYLLYAKRTGQFTPGQYIISRSTGVSSIAFTLPVRDRSGDMVYLIGSYSLDRYMRELSLSRLPQKAQLEIFDYFGTRLFSSLPNANATIGKPVSDDLFTRVLQKPVIFAEKIRIDGVPYLVSSGVYRANGLSLHITVRIPYDQVLVESYVPVVRILCVMLISCLVAFVISIWLAGKLFVGRIEKLTSYTQAVAEGNLSIRSGINTSHDEITGLMESFNKMAAALEERNASNQRILGEREELLQELQKRVADNLQLLSSMVNLQIGHAPNEAVRHSLMTTHSRVMALALVYETIYSFSDVQSVQMQSYCKGLCEFLVSLYSDIGSNVNCSVSGIDVSQPIERALPLALILNELVSNSLLHAFPNTKEGQIRIVFEKDNSSLLKMRIVDNGIGFESDVLHSDTLGYEMIEALVEQLHGSLILQSGYTGSEVTVRFPGV